MKGVGFMIGPILGSGLYQVAYFQQSSTMIIFVLNPKIKTNTSVHILSLKSHLIGFIYMIHIILPTGTKRHFLLILLLFIIYHL